MTAKDVGPEHIRAHMQRIADNPSNAWPLREAFRVALGETDMESALKVLAAKAAEQAPIKERAARPTPSRLAQDSCDRSITGAARLGQTP